MDFQNAYVGCSHEISWEHYVPFVSRTDINGICGGGDYRKGKAEMSQAQKAEHCTFPYGLEMNVANNSNFIEHLVYKGTFN